MCRSISRCSRSFLNIILLLNLKHLDTLGKDKKIIIIPWYQGTKLTKQFCFLKPHIFFWASLKNMIKEEEENDWVMEWEMIVQSTFIWANYLMPNSPYCMIYLWWETERENWSWSLLAVKGLSLINVEGSSPFIDSDTILILFMTGTLVNSSISLSKKEITFLKNKEDVKKKKCNNNNNK